MKLCQFVLAMVRRFFLLPFAALKFRGKRVWLICERGTDARDNGYHMFRYLRREHPEIEAWYVITKDSADVKKIADLGNVAYFGSVSHWLAYLRAEKILTAFEPHFCPSESYSFYKYVKRKNKQKIIFLQHGVIANDLPLYHQEKSGFDLFICGAKPEYDFVSGTFNYTHGEVRYTGLARFDALHDPAVKRQILIMPTYRKWLRDYTDEQVAQTEFMQRWQSLLRSPRLVKLSEEYDIPVVFFPHQLMQQYVTLFSSPCDRIIIADARHFDVQSLLKESSMLITDYSSVHFDFAYMHKPLMYYQFDEEEVFSRHCGRGYFDYRENGFGEVCTQESELLDRLEDYLKNGCRAAPLYLNRIEGFFPLYDDHNCERIYQEICTL